MSDREPGPPPARRASVAAVVLSHNSVDTLRAVLDAVQAQEPAPQRVYVVDNASADGTLEYLATRSGVVVLALPANGGVGVGHNAGWRAALADVPDLEFVWSLEHDSIPTAGCLARLVTTFDDFAAAGGMPAVIVPRQVTPGSAERPPDPCAPFTDERLTFNACLISTAAIREVGMLREDFFVGQEDREYGWRLAGAGYRVVRDQSAFVEHRNRHHHGHPRSTRREYYGVRNELYLRSALRREPFAVTKVALRSLGTLARVVVQRDRPRTRIPARVLAVRDGARGWMGPRSYGCLNDDVP